MNIAETEAPLKVIAKTCKCKEREHSNNDNNKKRNVMYSFVDSFHSLCLDKKDIILSELEACERLLKYSNIADKIDEETIKIEITELKMALDLMH
jgi:hypothetical protein